MKARKATSDGLWHCPVCKRKFRNPNQWHSCVRLEPGTLLDGKDAVVKKIYETIAAAVHTLGPHQVSTVGSGVMFKSGSTFASVKLKKDHADLEFFLPARVNDFPVFKVLVLSEKRIVHYVRLQTPRDVTARVRNWLRQSYDLIRRRE